MLAYTSGEDKYFTNKRINIYSFQDLQAEVRSLTNSLKSSQATEEQTSERESVLEEKIAKVNISTVY